MNVRHLFLIVATPLLITQSAMGQDIELEHTRDYFKKENLLKLSGAVSVNGLFQSGSASDGRLPFNGNINGAVNAKLFKIIDLPFSFFITNEGRQYQSPTSPSRICINPSYKWVKAHINNVTMIFSPYTLNGHQFTGIGVDAAPPNTNLTISAMYGRLQKAVNYDAENPGAQASFRRMGYGVKVLYRKENIYAGYTIFGAKDNAGSISFIPDSLGITAKQNVVMSYEGGVTIIKKLYLSAEYASSGLTTNNKDTIKVNNDGPVILRPFINANSTTNYFHAFNASLAYKLKRTVASVKYERIDPGYQTLGAYYFNQDLEIYSLNLSQQLLKDKLVLNGSLGFQYDNINQSKNSTNKRFVGAINASYVPNERLLLSGSYSTFQTYMNIKSQFIKINQIGPYENYDTLNFSQLSQNAMLTANYVLLKTKTRTHSVYALLNFFDANNKQGDVANSYGSTQLYNTSLAYSLQLIPYSTTVNAGMNTTYSIQQPNNFTTIGPIAGVSSKLFRQKLLTAFSTSYNVTSGKGMSNATTFINRLSLSYIYLKKHAFTFSVADQETNNSTGKKNLLLCQLGYNFTF